jgi:glutamine synthetase
VFLFHEKPFKGVNGSGKHNNWSVGTDTGVNFFNPGKTEKQGELFVAALACLAYGLNQHGAIIRGSVATAGNDHRLGAQEAPPAIISLYTGHALEAHIDKVINGGPLAGYAAGRAVVDPNCSILNEVKTGVEDRNRTASFPFCGNRFEFRAVGAEQNCSLPMAMVNTVFADGLRAMNELLASGKSLRDATAQLFQENRRIIFCGNGYSEEWPIEAERRGLPNLKNSVEAACHFNTDASKALFKRMNIFTEEEVDARAECMFENYATILVTEANCMLDMVNTGIEAALAADLKIYSDNKESRSYTRRNNVYNNVLVEHEKLQAAVASVPHGSEKAAAEHCLNVIKPAMEDLRSACDAAEQLVRSDLWPFPNYTEVCFGHHVSEHK